MEVSVIVVSWNVKDRLRKCLESVFEQKGVTYDVTVVDNDSKDGSAAMVSESFPQATIVSNKVNKGFAAANIDGLSHGKGEFVLLLNPDAEFDGEYELMRMVEFMRTRDKVGIMGPLVMGEDGNTQASVRRFPSLLSQVLIMLKLQHVFGSVPALKEYFQYDFSYEAEVDVDQVIGAALLTRRKLIDAIGFLDPKFFIWFEEIDFCKRARDAGWDVRFAPVAKVRHAGGESFAQALSVTKQRYFNNSLAVYMRKHHGLLAWAVVKFLGPASLFLAWLAQTFNVKRKKYDYAS